MIGPFTAVAIFLTVWWTVLFVVLPLGMNQGARERQDDGGDWGAPETPNLKKKFTTTTWLAVIVWAVIMVVVATGVIPLPDLPGAN